MLFIGDWGDEKSLDKSRWMIYNIAINRNADGKSGSAHAAERSRFGERLRLPLSQPSRSFAARSGAYALR